ncbi:hypothetical protein H310_10835 [Aphanomyces invadans]|uniref:Uncharacterized protein n=1 Tax=Aphanomyces invadans TaxID=157072 RepID=A0A024TP31_9STRA|nr:hypothetical protein H310_10835 [Aphanomyces invadans]ETV95778.1 hypothetical protein H310_10835 [Aphanomyces invadans]|eukprot:XP_008875529.1 hypothetical protein H310_10835 [Aphanomyces invadans]
MQQHHPYAIACFVLAAQVVVFTFGPVVGILFLLHAAVWWGERQRRCANGDIEIAQPLHVAPSNLVRLRSAPPGGRIVLYDQSPATPSHRNTRQVVPAVTRPVQCAYHDVRQSIKTKLHAVVVDYYHNLCRDVGVFLVLQIMVMAKVPTTLLHFTEHAIKSDDLLTSCMVTVVKDLLYLALARKILSP